MKAPLPKILPAATGLCLLFTVLPNNNARGQATPLYFDVNGATTGTGVTTGSSYSWDDANWSTVPTFDVATGNWAATDFPRFSGGVSGNAYTVTLNADESAAGLFETVGGVTLNLAAAGAGTLDITTVNGTAVTGVNGIVNVQGILGSSGSTVNITAPISGAGGVQPSNGGNINFFGNNTYSGGTLFGSSSTLINFNNNNAFGTGNIGLKLASGSFAPFLGKGGATITLPNNFVNGASGDGINFAADPNTPVVTTGTWSLGANTLNLRNNGNSTSPVTLQGAISGSAPLVVSGANGGKIVLDVANPAFTGTMTVGVSTAKAITLTLAVPNAIPNITGFVMAGGNFAAPDAPQHFGSATLGLSASSTIDGGSGTVTLDFANSSALTWTGVLNLVNWDPNTDTLRIGTDGTGLTVAELADIEENGSGLGTAAITPDGFIVVPEPSTSALGMIGVLGLAGVWMFKRQRTV